MMKIRILCSLLFLLGPVSLWAQSKGFPQFIQHRNVDWKRFHWAKDESISFSPIFYLQGDFDGDGALDVVAANRGLCYIRKSNRVFYKDTIFWKGDGEGYFTLKTGWTPSYRPALPRSWAFGSCLAKGDFDLDGDLDIFVGKSDGSLIKGDQPFPDGLLINNGKGQLIDEAKTRLPKNFDITSCCLAIDLDADGDLDLVVGTTPSMTHVYINDGKGFFKDEASKRLPKILGKYSPGAIRAGDLDGDGDVDLVFANGSLFAGVPKEPNLILLNKGKGYFQLSPKGIPEIPGATNDLALGDVDGDGDLDIVTANWTIGNHLFINDGKGGFKDETSNRWKPKRQYTNWIVMGDVDQDGDQDLIYGGFYNCRSMYDPQCDLPWRYYINDGNGFFKEGTLHFKNRQKPRSFMMYGGWRAQLIDLDQDGDQDLFAGEIFAEWLMDVHFNLRLHLLMEPGDWKRGEERVLTCYRSPGAGLFILFGSFKTAHLPLPGIGVWALDPFAMFPLGRLFVRPKEGMASMKLKMPPDSWLKDKELWIQGLFVDAKPGVPRPILRTNRIRNRIK